MNTTVARASTASQSNWLHARLHGHDKSRTDAG